MTTKGKRKWDATGSGNTTEKQNVKMDIDTGEMDNASETGDINKNPKKKTKGSAKDAKEMEIEQMVVEEDIDILMTGSGMVVDPLSPTAEGNQPEMETDVVNFSNPKNFDNTTHNTNVKLKETEKHCKEVGDGYVDGGALWVISNISRKDGTGAKLNWEERKFNPKNKVKKTGST